MRETEGILRVLEENEELSRLMSHPQVVKEEKMQLIENIFKGKVSDEIVGLLELLVEKDHFGKTKDVLVYFRDEVKEYKKIGTVHVTSAMELSKEQKEQVEKKLLETTNYVSFEMHYEVDTALIGRNGHPYGRQSGRQQHPYKVIQSVQGALPYSDRNGREWTIRNLVESR